MLIKVSIIIPFFNRMEYIAQLVESIPARDEIEILIIDDKSASQQTAQLKQYIAAQKESRSICYFYNDGMKSAGTCRNIGLAHAVGEWILFADSDDYFVRGFYETIAPWLQSEQDMVYFAPTSIDRVTGGVADRHCGFADWVANYLENPCAAAEYRLKGFYVVPWSKLYRRAFLVAQGVVFDEVLASNDVMFSLRAAFAASRFAVSPQVIYCVSKSPGSLIYSVDRAVLDARLDVFVCRYHFLKQHVPEEIFASFVLSGRNSILSYVEQKQSLRAITRATLRLVRQDVPVLEARLLNPFLVLRACKIRLVRLRRNRNYYKK